MNNTRLRQAALPLAEKCAVECYWLECDGMSNLIHFYLDKAGLPVSHHRGVVQLEGSYPTTHDWLLLGPWTIDYRLRIWYPEEPHLRVPSGIFRAREYPITYSTLKLLGVIHADLVRELEKYHPTPDWQPIAHALKARWEGKEISEETIESLYNEIKRTPPIFSLTEQKEVRVPRPPRLPDERK